MSANAEVEMLSQQAEETSTKPVSAQSEVVAEGNDAIDNSAMEAELFGDADEVTMSKDEPVDENRLSEEIASYLHEGCDLESLSMKKVYEELGNRLKVDVETFTDDFKQKVKAIVTKRVQSLTSALADADTPANDEDDKHKKRRRTKGDQADGDTPVKPSKKSRRAAESKRGPVGEPLSIAVAGTKFLAQPRETPSGKLGYYGTGVVIAELDGKKVEMQCMFQCAVISTAEEQPAAESEETAAA